MRRTATGLHPNALHRLAGAVKIHVEYARKFTQDDRDEYDRTGDAMPGGRYPVRTQEDLQNAVEDYVRTGRPSAVAAHIHAMAKKHNLQLPSVMANS